MMGTSCITPSPSSSSLMACGLPKPPKQPYSSSIPFGYRNHNCSFLALSPSSLRAFPSSSTEKSNIFTVLALVEDRELAAASPSKGDSEDEGSASRNMLRPCELYVCNLPRSFDIAQLLDMFKPYGTVQSVEVSRNAETGVSRGCGYVTMSSLKEAKAAISSLDGIDVGGREMRVKYSVDMSSRGNIEALNSPTKNFIFETPYKLYVGNLAWAVKPEDLKNLFTQFGTVVSARVLHDRKGGKSRVYGFLSFSSVAELKAALSLNGTDYSGRTLLLREVVQENKT